MSGVFRQSDFLYTPHPRGVRWPFQPRSHGRYDNTTLKFRKWPLFMRLKKSQQADVTVLRPWSWMTGTPYIKIKLQTCFQALDLDKEATENVRECFFRIFAICGRNQCIWEAADEFLMLLKFPVLQHLIFQKRPDHEVLAGIIAKVSGKQMVSPFTKP